jgi:adenine phosphoribosyltransferase
MEIAQLKTFIRDVPDFPKPGIVFKDIAPLLQHRFFETIDVMSRDINWAEIDAVMGIESRGFIFASALAQRNQKGFIPIRKKGKLPPPVVQESYSLEYGKDCLELPQNGNSTKQGNVLIVDDVLATGGTIKAAINLCEKADWKVMGTMFLINLKALNQLPTMLSQRGIKFYSMIDY